MNDFRNQIQEDIKEYQSNFPDVPNINKDEWAFNYWVLDKLFYEDEELIEDKILDYHDMGIDAFEFYEDTKDIYLIQNKYYSDGTAITADYVKNDFLIRAITALEHGTYKKSDDLQKAFNKYKNHSDFTVYLWLFVTNNNRCKEAEDYLKEYNKNHPNYRAEIFYLNDIQDKYFGEVEQNKRDLTVRVETVNKGTVLSINNDAYKLANVIDAKYVFTPVVSMYKIYETAKKNEYPIFDKNIREYLGNKGRNKSIYNTLLDENDRKNFFYYNNGITIICDEMGTIHPQPSEHNMNAYFEIQNPQIVNGCQTVNTIYEALSNEDPNNLEENYKDTFVMLKILEINKADDYNDILYKNIVKYNNSQNPIDEKTFVANTSEFIRLQNEFKNKGFLLLIKQSDKNKFASEYKSITKLKAASSDRIKKFGLPEIKKVDNVYIDLSKFLQVINAFVSGGYVAYTKRGNMLKFGSEQYNVGINFIKNGSVTIDVMLDLYLLYKRAEVEKKKSSDKRTPIPYYLIDLFSIYECNQRKEENISSALDDTEKINRIIKLYKAVTKAYTTDYLEDNGIEYNTMIKRPINYKQFDKLRNSMVEAI